MFQSASRTVSLAPQTQWPTLTLEEGITLGDGDIRVVRGPETTSGADNGCVADFQVERVCKAKIKETVLLLKPSLSFAPIT